MMCNYYWRKSIHLWKEITSVGQSLVLNSIPEDQLVSLEQITQLVAANKDNDCVKNKQQVRTLLEQLIQEGFVGECIGIKMEKFLKTL